MTTPDDEPRRDAPRFIVPVPVGSVAPRGDDAHATPPVASASQGGLRTPRVTHLDRPDAVAFAVILLWVSVVITAASIVATLVATALVVEAADGVGVDAAAVRAGGGFMVVASLVVLLLQVAVTVLVARGSDVARVALTGIAVVAVGLAVVAGAAGLGAVVLVVAVAALFVPSSSAWFREIRRGGGAR